MNLNKTIKELTNRLDEVHPASTTNGGISHDGIQYWKGKKIISAKDWNELYEKNSTYTDTYKIILRSRKPLQYFPDDFNGSINLLRVIDELKEAAEKWNKDYYELLEYRKNPTLGRMKCSKCLLSGSNDDPIFVGIEKVFARIVTNQCKNDNIDINSDLLTYHCNIMNIFSCPFESKEESKLPYIKEDLFALHQISFAIEQALSTFFEITKQNEVIFEIDFENDIVQEIHTKYNGEPESWGWQENVKEQLSKVKPLSKIVIRDEQDIYNILTNREKLELLLEEYEKKNSHRLASEEEQLQVCYDENTLCVNNDELLTNNNLAVESCQTQMKYQDSVDYLHKGENRHSKTMGELYKEQQILLKDNKEAIIDFLLDNKDSIRIEDLKICEPIYRCYRKKGNCHICKSLTNIICISCSNYKNEVWLCTNHCQQHKIDKHE